MRFTRKPIGGYAKINKKTPGKNNMNCKLCQASEAALSLKRYFLHKQSNKMDNSLLAVRNLNHKYVAAERMTR